MNAKCAHLKSISACYRRGNVRNYKASLNEFGKNRKKRLLMWNVVFSSSAENFFCDLKSVVKRGGFKGVFKCNILEFK